MSKPPNAANTANTAGTSTRRAHPKQGWLKRLLQRYRGRLALSGFLFLMFVLYFFPSMFITIYPGYNGVLFKRFIEGVVENRVYQEGVHVLWPWNIMYQYDTRIQETHESVPVLTTNGLVVTLQVSVRYFPDREKLPILHKTVGPEYVEKVVKPITMAAVRIVIGKYSPEEIYSTETQVIQEEIYMEIIRQNGRIPIVYEAFLIKTIDLPDVVRSSIESKLKVQQEFFTYEFRLKKAAEEIKRKMLEAESIRVYNNIVTESLNKPLLTWFGVLASLRLAESDNAKVVLFGDGEGGLPVILNLEGADQPNQQAFPGTRDANRTRGLMQQNSSFYRQLRELEQHEERFEELLLSVPGLQNLLDEFDLDNLDIYSPSGEQGQ